MMRVTMDGGTISHISGTQGTRDYPANYTNADKHNNTHNKTYTNNLYIYIYIYLYIYIYISCMHI